MEWHGCSAAASEFKRPIDRASPSGAPAVVNRGRPALARRVTGAIWHWVGTKSGVLVGSLLVSATSWHHLDLPLALLSPCADTQPVSRETTLSFKRCLEKRFGQQVRQETLTPREDATAVSKFAHFLRARAHYGRSSLLSLVV